MYEVAYTADDGEAVCEPGGANYMLRFYGEQEQTEFLKKHLNRTPEEVDKLIQRLRQDGRLPLAPRSSAI